MTSVGEYRLIDEIFAEQRPLFSGRAVLLFTWFGMVVVGVVLSLINAYRAQDANLAFKTVLAFVGWLLMIIAFIAVALTSPEAKIVLRPISLAATLALALYLSHENDKVVKSHALAGRRLAPIWVPLAVTLALWAAFIVLTIAIGLSTG